MLLWLNPQPSYIDQLLQYTSRYWNFRNTHIEPTEIVSVIIPVEIIRKKIYNISGSLVITKQREAVLKICLILCKLLNIMKSFSIIAINLWIVITIIIIIIIIKFTDSVGTYQANITDPREYNLGDILNIMWCYIK